MRTGRSRLGPATGPCLGLGPASATRKVTAAAAARPAPLEEWPPWVRARRWATRHCRASSGHVSALSGTT